MAFFNESRLFSQEALQRETAREAAKRAGSSTAAVRWAFIARAAAADPVPPMARILRGGGGRGGATRLKLYLSFLWLARAKDDPVFAYPAQQLAALLGLDSPQGAGARRVQEALKWLERESFVALDQRRGDATRVHLLDDAGSGKPYRGAGALAAQKPRRSRAEREKHYYVQLDKEFWTEGWVAHLSGAAVAMYLAALHEQRGRADEPIWVSPRIGRERYDLSDETRNKGLRELVDLKLLDLQRRPVPVGSFDERYRARNMYVLVSKGMSKVDGATRSASTNRDDLSAVPGSW